MPSASASRLWQNSVGQPAAHQRVGEFVEGVGEDDDLVILAQLVEEGARARHRAHFGDHLLDVRQAELVLAQDVQAVLHQLVVVRLVARRAAQLGNAGALGEFDPDFGDEDTFEVEADDLHGSASCTSSQRISASSICSPSKPAWRCISSLFTRSTAA
jgi:hypothetical protein